MAKKTTLNELGATMTHVVAHMEKLATKEDLEKLETKVDGLKVKADGIQNTLDREAVMRSDQKIPERLAKLEEKVFGRNHA